VEAGGANVPKGDNKDGMGSTEGIQKPGLEPSDNLWKNPSVCTCGFLRPTPIILNLGLLNNRSVDPLETPSGGDLGHLDPVYARSIPRISTTTNHLTVA